MTENKSLTRQTTLMLMLDVLVVFWDMGLATYHFIKGRWIAGILLVAVVGLLVWVLARLIETRHDTQRMQLRYEYIMKVLESREARIREALRKDKSDKEENPV